jgi:hypothetical protein
MATRTQRLDSFDGPPNDHSRATRLFDQLSSHWHYSAQPEPGVAEEGAVEEARVAEVELPSDDFVVSDFQGVLAQFNYDQELLAGFGFDTPAIAVDEDNVPVSLIYLVSNTVPMPFLTLSLPPGRYRDWGRLMIESLYEIRRRGFRAELAWINRREAANTFRRLSIAFLATRIAGVRELAGQISSFIRLPQVRGGQPVKTPGCNFEVTTDNGGLRVFWSGASYISPTYFGHPTSPAKSVLQSGTYVFGVDGGAYGSDIQWDMNAKVSLPGAKTSVHLNY